ncbi:hypothetical protein [Adlercreutzia murintestinalis]|uniref:hypothetical protein n=1 Tax=Adlercreutzia murintestinalis TaxID=2941325 RepID=UPI00203C5C76|nr:hypothetical protein [Adlercreutzia murintestinalis]
MRLIRCEFVKLFCRRSILVLFALFSAVNLVKIYSEWNAYSFLSDGGDERSWRTVHWSLYDQYRGPITPEKVQQLLATWQPLAQATADMTANTATDDADSLTGNLYSDRNLLEKYFVDPMQYCYEYSERAASVAEKARQNAAVAAQADALYQQRESAAIYQIYAGRTVPAFAYTEMANYYLNYDFSLVLVLLLGLYGVTGTFTTERETQMDRLLLTNPNGGSRTILAKLVAVSGFLLLVTAWFSLLDLAGFVAAFGTFEGLGQPVYAIPSFAEAPVGLSVFQFAVLAAALRGAGLWALGMLWLAVSLRCGNALAPLVANLALTAALVVGGASVAYSHLVWAKALDPYSLLAGRPLLAQTEFLDIGGFPVLSWQAALAFSLVVGLIAAVAIYMLSPRNALCPIRRAR